MGLHAFRKFLMRKNDVARSTVMKMRYDVTKNQNGVRIALNNVTLVRPVICRAISPNHRGRHLGKINGHNSTYVKVWRCTFGRITRVVRENHGESCCNAKLRCLSGLPSRKILATADLIL